VEHHHYQVEWGCTICAKAQLLWWSFGCFEIAPPKGMHALGMAISFIGRKRFRRRRHDTMAWGATNDKAALFLKAERMRFILFFINIGIHNEWIFDFLIFFRVVYRILESLINVRLLLSLGKQVWA
jgi:hypothetical protein